jgi:threonine dehydratase
MAPVVTYDRYTEDREAIGARLAAERKMTLIPPYDHPHVMAGQGTATLELLQETGPLDALFVCLGGGGLLSGAALAARAGAGLQDRRGTGGRQRWPAIAARRSYRPHRYPEDHRRWCARRSTWASTPSR